MYVLNKIGIIMDVFYYLFIYHNIIRMIYIFLNITKNNMNYFFKLYISNNCLSTCILLLKESKANHFKCNIFVLLLVFSVICQVLFL